MNNWFVPCFCYGKQNDSLVYFQKPRTWSWMKRMSQRNTTLCFYRLGKKIDLIIEAPRLVSSNGFKCHRSSFLWARCWWNGQRKHRLQKGYGRALWYPSADENWSRSLFHPSTGTTVIDQFNTYYQMHMQDHSWFNANKMNKEKPKLIL